MRFNPKANIDKSRVRDVGGGGGLGGGLGGGGLGGSGGGGRMQIPGGKAGGGIGGIILVIVVLVIGSLMGGGSLLSGLGGGGGGGGSASETDRYEECLTGEDANENSDCARVLVENSMRAYWSQALPEQAQVKFSDATVTTFSGQVSTGCGAAQSAMGPFYCPPDTGIYLDSTFFDDVLIGQLGGKGGDFVEPYVLAHEYGHHIQNLTGQINQVKTQQGPKSDAVRLELQADCYAGMWTRAAQSTETDADIAIFESIDQADITEAMDAAQAVGDDRIQQRSGRGVNPEAWTHGSAEQRQRWFQVGMTKGSMAACDTFSASSL
ncbi:MAG: neutral zinc metallopeptidase [Nocardioides sp.]|uniref:KPN_02809 family neutral zinc metallopeptidase n=1 Tax=Nocardioides sp. TaxID=35761 RepID=UPI003F0D762A